MKGDAQIHFLGRFQEDMAFGTDTIPFQEEIKPRIGEQLILRIIQQQCRLLDFLPAVLLQNITPIKLQIRKIPELFIKTRNSRFPHPQGDLFVRLII